MLTSQNKNIIQNIKSSDNNSTTTNLASAATFTGTADETFGVNGIQVYHFADQDCTINIDQSLDGTNWDVNDTWDCLANEECTRTLVSVAPYYRARVTNTGDSTTTTIRFATGMTPIINPLPRSLTDDGRLKTETHIGDHGGRHAHISPTNTLNTNETVRLVGTNFDGTTKDTNFWTETVTGTGSATQSGEIKLETGATANSTAIYESVRRARFVVGAALIFTGAFKFNDADVTDNVRRCGAYDDNDGYFFQLDGETFSVGTRKSTSDTLVSSGSFNGDYGPGFEIDNTSYYKFDIEYTPLGVFYYVNSVLLHKTLGGHLTNKLTVPIRFENLNDNGNTTDVVFDCLGAVILRQGPLVTNPTYKWIDSNTTTVCKVGAGTLHRIIVADNVGDVEIYDNTAGGGPVIGILDTSQGSEPGYSIEYGTPFSNGLTIVTTGGVVLTVTYE